MERSAGHRADGLGSSLLGARSGWSAKRRGEPHASGAVACAGLT